MSNLKAVIVKNKTNLLIKDRSGVVLTNLDITDTTEKTMELQVAEKMMAVLTSYLGEEEALYKYNIRRTLEGFLPVGEHIYFCDSRDNPCFSADQGIIIYLTTSPEVCYEY